MIAQIADITDLVWFTVEQILTVPGERRPKVTARAVEGNILVYGDDKLIATVPIDRIKINLHSSMGFLKLLKRELVKE